LESIAHSRDRLSEEMQFEDAARQHKRLEKCRTCCGCATNWRAMWTG
jgi:hypothetical protein